MDNLHRTGIGWDGLAVPRSAQESQSQGAAREAPARGRKEPQVSIPAQFSQLGTLELSLFVTKQSQQQKRSLNVTKAGVEGSRRERKSKS